VARPLALAAGLAVSFAVIAVVLAALWPLTDPADKQAANSAAVAFGIEGTWEVPGTPVVVLPEADSLLVATSGEGASTTIYRVGGAGPKAVLTSESSVVDMAGTPTRLWLSTFAPGGDPELTAVDRSTFEPALVVPHLTNPIAAGFGRVFATDSSDGGSRVVSLDAETGAELATYESPSQVMDIVVGDGRVYLMPLEGTRIQILDDQLQPLGAISPEGGWVSRGVTDALNGFSVLVHKGPDGYLEHFEGMGAAPSWTVPSDGGSIGATSQYVVTATQMGDIIARDLLTGEVLASIDLSDGVGGGTVYPTAAVQDGTVWVADDNGGVTRLSLSH
jgi:outer membrane protein assembly factor BamB